MASGTEASGTEGRVSGRKAAFGTEGRVGGRKAASGTGTTRRRISKQTVPDPTRWRSPGCWVCTSIYWKKCRVDCQYAPHFPIQDQDRLNCVLRVFPSSELRDQLSAAPRHLLIDALRPIIHEAELRLSKFVPFSEPSLLPGSREASPTPWKESVPTSDHSNFSFVATYLHPAVIGSRPIAEAISLPANNKQPPRFLLMHALMKQEYAIPTAMLNQQYWRTPSLGSCTWSSLPRDLLVLILRRLPIPDYVRFGAVCRSWNAIFSSKPCPPAPQFPWIWLRDHICPEPSLSFLCPSDSRIYHFPCVLDEDDNGNTLPTQPIHRFNCGWMMVSIGGFSAKPNTLYNPISGARLKVPRYPRALFRKFVVLPQLTLGDDKLPSAIAYFELPEGAIGIWRPCNGHKLGWTRYLHEKFPRIRYGNIICYKGLLYAVTNTGELRLVEFNKHHENSYDDHPQAFTVINPLFSSPPRLGKHLAALNLVECKGDLLLVRHSFLDDLVEVFQANFGSGLWEVVVSLGNQVLFLEFSLPVCMSARDVSGYAENCIYFISQHGRTFGRYQLGDKKLFRNTCMHIDPDIYVRLLPELS